MQQRTRFQATLLVFTLTAAPALWSQSKTRPSPACAEQTPAQMLLDPLTVPESDLYPVLFAPLAPATVTVPAAGDPVVALRIAPPNMLDPLDAYVPTVDYTACIGPAGGELRFLVPGSYVVQIQRLSGILDVLIVDVEVKSLGTCYKSGELKEFDCPTPPKAFEGDDVDEPPDFRNQCTVTSIADLVAKVTAAAGTGMIDLILVDHGCEGSISINGMKVSCDRADEPNLRAFCGLQGRIRSITLLSCSTAHGAAGTAFLQKLSRKFGGIPVTGYTGNVSSWSKDGTRRWGSYGEAKTETVNAGALPRLLPPARVPVDGWELPFLSTHLPRSLGAIVLATRFGGVGADGR
jgi:hypothetical protein